MKSQKKTRILFVCLGNICRSPAAEGIMKKMVKERHLQDVIEIDSAGTSGWNDGSFPDPRTLAHGKKRGYDFCSISRKFVSADFDRFDYIVVMDSNNFANVKALATTQEEVEKIHLMTDFCTRITSHDHIPDPYYGSASGFELVMDLLEDACEGLLHHLKVY
ncbi:MAG: low molecular weight phosphotyrosine protein phosphatase [Dysgonamonadaceae bacterium]|nr:low molecular weight phosphotyrosine protein phosphatase [Dysgonamonadaceae bacterium]